MTSESCLVTKLSAYVDLSESTREHLRTMEQDEKPVRRHEDVALDTENALQVVKSGWFYSYIDLPDGRRQIVKIHHPGDILGFHEISLTKSSTILRAAENGVLCPFPKNKLDVIFRESPQLTALLFSVAVRDHLLLIDMIRALGRMSAREKLAYLLLELISRLRVTNKSMTDTIRMPLNQTEIGDTVGLTNVYVSRTLQALEEDGMIARTNDTVTILREDALIRMTDYENRYVEIDTSWFPEGQA